MACLVPGFPKDWSSSHVNCKIATALEFSKFWGMESGSYVISVPGYPKDLSSSHVRCELPWNWLLRVCENCECLWVVRHEIWSYGIISSWISKRLSSSYVGCQLPCPWLSLHFVNIVDVYEFCEFCEAWRQGAVAISVSGFAKDSSSHASCKWSMGLISSSFVNFVRHEIRGLWHWVKGWF